MKSLTAFPRSGLTLLLLAAISCGSDASRGKPADDAIATGGVATRAEGTGSSAVAFSDADLDAFIAGLGAETEILRTAQERLASAATPQQRVDALQSASEGARIPEAARRAPLPLERYRAVRDVVVPVLETLDFQGKLEGPMTMDTTRVGESVRARLRGDAMASLSPQSRAALTARLPRIQPVWAEFAVLRAQGG